MEETAFKLPQTGGEDRTPRSEIVSTREEGWEYEPDAALDLSPSMFWSTLDEEDRKLDYPHPSSRRYVLEAFWPMYVGHMEQFDADAEAEQAEDHDDEELDVGGVMCAGFSGHAFMIGDMNTANVLKKMEQAWETAAQRAGTLIGPAIRMLNEAFQKKFANNPRRVQETTIITDGEPQDPEAIIPHLETANERHVYLVGILGHGKTAKKTARLYREAGDRNAQRTGKKRVHVVNFDAVSDPVEIGRDLCKMAS